MVNERLDICCDAMNCSYNREHKCIASKVGIAGTGAKQACQTECATFKM
ncbi:hypothetical protein P261_00524 [Lachnospiraceae bacterium TWA4]|nr:hypothetical protein P261_00524 [Lachnospiraceae bacterium TWA4]